MTGHAARRGTVARGLGLVRQVLLLQQGRVAVQWTALVVNWRVRLLTLVVWRLDLVSATLEVNSLRTSVARRLRLELVVW